MKPNIHPKYKLINITCSCGNIMKIRSTLDKNLNLEVCGKCHPFYTGKQKTIHAGGRIEQFKNRFSILRKNKDYSE